MVVAQAGLMVLPQAGLMVVAPRKIVLSPVFPLTSLYEKRVLRLTSL